MESQSFTKRTIQFGTVALLILGSSVANAALFNFTGNIENHNDVIQIAFTLNQDATNVRVWTDSFDNGANFDPITALWRADGTLLAENDDDDTIDPATQTFWDSGFSFASLAQGSYIFTVARWDNFAAGSLLSDGFDLDNETPIPVSGEGTFYSVWLDGVDEARNDVPEPSTLALFALGLPLLRVQRKSAA